MSNKKDLLAVTTAAIVLYKYIYCLKVEIKKYI